MVDPQAFKNALIQCLFADEEASVYAQDLRGFWIRISEAKSEGDQVLAMNNSTGKWFAVQAWEVRK